MSTAVAADVDSIANAERVDMKFEAVVIPLRRLIARRRSIPKLGWRLDADFPFESGFRVVQFTPPTLHYSGVDLKHYTLIATTTGGGGAVDIAVRIQEESGHGRSPILTSSKEMQIDFAPLASGDSFEFKSCSISVDESPKIGRAIEIPDAVNNQPCARETSVAIYACEVVHDAFAPRAAGGWCKFVNFANLIRAAVFDGAVKVASGVKDDSADRVFAIGI